jgi:hypothetical protein
MKTTILLPFFLIFFAVITIQAQTSKTSASVYTQKFNDTEAYYFTTENYGIKTDGSTDVSEALQKAINQVKSEKNFGILFIPEGKYKISKTLYIPPAVRLIGYGKNRPEIILGVNSPGFSAKDTAENKTEKYMIWFTGNMVTDETQVRDANPGTFYSAITNIDFRIEKGNPNAVALRTHYAQHGFVSHSVINIGNGKAGISQLGNEMENVQFLGGDYGIITGPTSPSWPMMMVDTYFEGQRKAAIQCHNSGLAIVNMQVKDVPVGIEIEDNATDRLYLENCRFENISKAGIIINDKESTLMQLNVLKTVCSNVPVFVKFRQSKKQISGEGKIYRVEEFTHGLVMENMTDNSAFKTISRMETLQQLPAENGFDIPVLPAMEKWVNIKDLGAKAMAKPTTQKYSMKP